MTETLFMTPRYIMITPTRNDADLLEKTAACVTRQTLLPEKWFIVNDASSDRTPQLLRALEAQHEWITGLQHVEKHQQGFRRIGGQAVVHQALEKIQPENYDFIVRTDCDVLFGQDFMARIFDKFEADSRLGIASGVCHVYEKDRLVEEKTPRFHTRGPFKVYLSECFQEIGGLDCNEGWDTIDEIKANMLGWRTYSYPDLKIIHQRKTQTSQGVLTGQKNMGAVAYYTGYHPVFMLCRAMRRMLDRPFVFSGIFMLAGYLRGYLKNEPQVNDPQLIRYMRRQQINKLLGKQTIWQ